MKDFARITLLIVLVSFVNSISTLVEDSNTRIQRIRITVKPNEIFTIKLKNNASMGAFWEILDNPASSVIRFISKEPEKLSIEEEMRLRTMRGLGRNYVYTFKAGNKPNHIATITLGYKPIWMSHLTEKIVYTITILE